MCDLIELDVDPIDVLEERLEALGSTVAFLHGEESADDDAVLRAMLVFGGTDDEIVNSFAIASAATQVSPDDKGRYAFGVLKNLMLKHRAIDDPEDDDDYGD